ncbi:extracellular solute-binding protein family 1 [Phlyctema vagabunda]|uniref:Extracellular solute-binding protein family 1 n=1 Tax=Phlyctema vagabunda TaxID=108571 RepID=A0ABR4PTJ8_9HELO
MASVNISPEAPEVPVVPAEVYTIGSINSPAAPVKLRIATGGAGQSGLIGALAKGFIAHEVSTTGCADFAVAWLLSDTSASFNYLGSRSADLSITYHKIAEGIAMRQGIADRREYAWRDHWLLVGPQNDPAKLSVEGELTIYEHFARLFQAAIETASSPSPVRFLSRYDKSAANIKESNLWSAIGQTPWSYPYSTWYHRYVDFPFAALKAAAQLGEYTITDRGTWLAVEPWIRERMEVFKLGTDDEDDPLLNPAHLLVGTRGENREMANKFADWIVRCDGGQKIIEEFEINGMRLYSTAPTKD